MLKYFLFSFKSILYKKSYYISTFVYFITLILVTYLFPAILKQPFINVLTQWFIWTMVVLAIAITITMSTIYVFKSGIEDGTEILISSKPISRAECIWAKLLLMFIIILFQSFMSFIIALFLPLAKYGMRENMPIAGGFFLFSFIVSMFFCASGMMFALISKQQAAMFLNFSLGFLLVLITSINVILAKTPGKIIKDEGYSLTNKMYIPAYDKTTKKKFLSEGYLLKYKNKIITKNNIQSNKNINFNELIKNIYQNAYNNSTFVKTVNIDPAFQWIMLLNTSNFYLNEKTSPFWYNDLSYAFNLTFANIARLNFDIPTNNNFITIKISNLDKQTKNQNYVPTSSTSTSIGIFNSEEKLLKPIFSIPIIKESKFIFMPEYDIDSTTFLPNPSSLKFNLFSSEQILSNSQEFQRFYNYVFGNSNSLYSEFWMKKENFKKSLLQYAINYNFIDFMQEKVNNALNIVLMNIQNNPNEQIPLYYNGLPIYESNPMIKPVYYKDLKKEIKKFDNDFDYDIWNKIDFTSLSWLLMVSTTQTFIARIQGLFSEAIIKQQEANSALSIDYNKENDKKIVDFLMNKRELEYNNTNPVVISDINKVANINKAINELKDIQPTDPTFMKKQIELDYDIKQNSVYFNSNFYNLDNLDNFASFTNIKLDYMINGFGLIFGWISLSSILILMASGVYARKDFK